MRDVLPGGDVESWVRLAQHQDGVMSRSQLLVLGWTPRQVQSRLDHERWQRLLPGVYATFTGPVPARARLWAAVLYAGDGAALGGRAALWCWGVLATPPGQVEVCVPDARRVRDQPSLHARRRTDLSRATHPSAAPPRLRVEDAVLDLADEASDVDAVVSLVIRATQQRRTTAPRLRDTLGRRSRHRRRALLSDLLADVEDGVQSTLEQRYRRDVQRRHRLPEAELNACDRVDGQTRYRDARYRRWRLRVELDGREAHPQDRAFRDRRRDNAGVVSGDATLRYGWVEVAGTPCDVAAEVVLVLRQRGWRGRPRPCRPACPVVPT